MSLEKATHPKEKKHLPSHFFICYLCYMYIFGDLLIIFVSFYPFVFLLLVALYLQRFSDLSLLAVCFTKKFMWSLFYYFISVLTLFFINFKYRAFREKVNNPIKL